MFTNLPFVFMQVLVTGCDGPLLQSGCHRVIPAVQVTNKPFLFGGNSTFISHHGFIQFDKRFRNSWTALHG